MIKKGFVSFVLLGISLIISAHAICQISYDTSITKDRKNVIRYNPTPSMVVGLESFVLGYERVLSPHQSISVNVGNLKFRQFLNLGLEQYDVTTNRKSGGISLAIDYRRYFKKRNRGFAPDGLYWGPFVTYYTYRHQIGATYQDPSDLSTSDVLLKTKLTAYHLGVELGYQFVVAKRVTIDLILIGPSWGKYQANFDIEGNLDLNEESELYKAVSEVIIERVPGLGSLITDRSAAATGFFSTNTIGMRYLFQIGFLF